jgi:tetratricopeptide (TPR) repeat protein
MEAVVLALVVASPWAFGCVHALPKLALALGLAALLGLWAVRLLVEWRLTWHRCPVALCLAGLFLLGVFQITPLPAGALDTLSPATARLCRQLLPASPEQVTAGESLEPDRFFAGSAVSVYPGGTYAVLVQVLAVVALFVVVRNNVASSASFRRLALVALVNGAALALFGLVHFFSAPPHVVYWSIPSGGAVFGPFINKNHFACYINLSFGLGLGALLAAAATSDGEHRPPLLLNLLKQPALLWLGGALSLMLAASVLCLSRGGLLSLVAAAVPCLLLLARRRSRRWRGLLAGLLVGAAALGLVAWLGREAVEERMSTLWQGQAFEDGRWALWERTLPIAGDFPLWGAGYGTFQYLEPLRRPPASGLDFAYDHAHNDYLELLIEGGALALALALAAAALTYARGARAFRRRNAADAGLALGALFGLGAVLAHSVGDFGMHIPAVPLLATVVAAQLCALGARRHGRTPPAVSLRLGGLAPLGGAAAAVLVAMTLTAAAWRAEAAERYRLAAGRCPADDEDAQARRLAYLRAATALVPEDAGLERDLARAYLDAYERGGRGSDDLHDALRHYLRARALCPLLDEPHLRLAVHVGDMAQSDAMLSYLARAQLVLPYDERVWYLSGKEEAARGRPELAWPCWLRSLECSDRFLQPILEEGLRSLPADEVAERILPDQPGLLLRAAALLEARPEAAASARPFLEKAVRLLDARTGSLDRDELYARARARRSLGRFAEACRDYEAVVERAPDRPDWRFEFAQMLYDAGQLQEARRQLAVLVRRDSTDVAAQDLYRQVELEIAAGKDP